MPTNTKSGARALLHLGQVLGTDRIAEMQRSFRQRLVHTVVIMDSDANVIVDEDGQEPVWRGQRPDPCVHCKYILSSQVGAGLCHASDVEGARIAKLKAAPLLYRCWTSKSNVAIPITVGKDDVIGHVYAGQFFACVDDEHQRRDAEALCRQHGFVIHDGRDPEGQITKSIKSGFFWTRAELMEWEDKQAPFRTEGRLQEDDETLALAWRSAPRIGYKEAIASVQMLHSLANMVATMAYDKLAYELFNQIMIAVRRFSLEGGELNGIVAVNLSEAEGLVGGLVGARAARAESVARLAELLFETRRDLYRRKTTGLRQKIEWKKFWSGLFGPNSELAAIQGELARVAGENEGHEQ